MVKQSKFSETERAAVIRATEDHYDASLSPIGRRRKWLRDSHGRSFWLLGGIGDWHGIPEAMMNHELAKPTSGILVIAKRLQEAMRIYGGPIAPLLQGREKLFRAARTTGDYQFTITTQHDRLNINQVPGLALQLIAELPYSDEQKARDQIIRDLEMMLNRLSDEDRARLLKRLGTDNE